MNATANCCSQLSVNSPQEAPANVSKEESAKFAAIRLPHEDSPRAVTPRQLEVWKWYAQGLGTREVAARMGISYKTVETYREQLKLRTGLRNAVEFTRAAIALGLVPVPSTERRVA